MYVAIVASVIGFSIVYTAIQTVAQRIFAHRGDPKKTDEPANVLIMCMNEKDYNEFRKGNVWISALDDV